MYRCDFSAVDRAFHMRKIPLSWDEESPLKTFEELLGVAFTAVAACGLMGFAASSPATVIHSRTCHRFTAPLVTYGSARANFSATSGESPLNNNMAPSTGLASAPPSTSSPRALAAQALSRCASRNSARLKRSLRQLRKTEGNAFRVL